MRSVFILLSILIFGAIKVDDAAFANRKKILSVASYHTEKGEWSGGIKSRIAEILEPRTDVQRRAFNMHTRLAKTENKKNPAALSARRIIESWQIVDHLPPYAGGTRIGSHRGDTMTNRKEQKHFEAYLNKSFDVRFVDRISDWKTQFIQLQKEADMLVLGSLKALDRKGTSMADIITFAEQNTKIPTAAWDAFMKDACRITLSTIPQEQEQWAATKALEILDGKSPQAIPVAHNRKGKLYLNMKIAKKLGITFLIEKNCRKANSQCALIQSLSSYSPS